MFSELSTKNTSGHWSLDSNKHYYVPYIIHLKSTLSLRTNLTNTRINIGTNIYQGLDVLTTGAQKSKKIIPVI